MKNNRLYKYLSFFPASILLLMASCSDDKTTSPGTIPDKTFTASSGLTLYYNGFEMPGKSVKFSQNGDKGILTAFSTFDLSQLSALGLSGELPSPGIIPGSPETVWNVNLVEGDGVYLFSGKGENSACTYDYSGSVSNDKLEISISNAVLKSYPLSMKAWAPSPIKHGENGTYASLPIYVDWQFEPDAELDLNLSPLLQSITTLPLIPVYNNTAYMSLSEALVEVLKSVVFREDGNIMVSYISTVGGAASIAQNQPNGLQYTTEEPGTLKLFVNPLSFFSFLLENTSGSTPPENVDLTGTGLYPSGTSTSKPSSLMAALSDPMMQALVKAMMKNLLPQIAEGIPLEYTLDGDKLYLYIDTEQSLAIIKTVMETILENDEAVQRLLAELGNNETLAPLLKDLPALQQQVEKALAATTQLRIGFSFDKILQ